jgi:RNA polymerase sigma-70 factor, ECF subfamily
MSLEITDDFLEQLKAQNQEAFSKLVKFHHRQMIHVARAIIGEAQAEEVVQEAWGSIYRNLTKFEGRSSLKTWMFTIVSNGAKTRLRKESRQVLMADVEGSMSGLSEDLFGSDGGWSRPPPKWDVSSPDQLLEEDQLQDCIEKTAASLPEQQRAVFVLREIEQQDLSEVRNILELSDSNVRVLLHRARVKLMQVIDRYQETGIC